MEIKLGSWYRILAPRPVVLVSTVSSKGVSNAALADLQATTTSNLPNLYFEVVLEYQLYTVINNSTGSGAHTALLVNASQRAIFDPAGSWYHPQLPERNDVHYGMSDPIVDFYVDYHTRITYRTVIQEIEVSPQVAEAALREIQAYGAVRRGHCADATSEILRKLPGFEDIPRTYFPRKLSRAFGARPGVATTIARDDDPDDNSGVILAPPALYVSQGRS